MEFGAVEDLFQETSGPRVTADKIHARLQKLQNGGCNQKIAWSKLGCIAIITANGTGVETRHLACNPEDGHWALSDAYPIASVHQNHKGRKLQHVSWSSSGAELAVVDVTGRVSFYTVYLAVNQLQSAGVHNVSDDDMNAIVGFWWLPADRQGATHPFEHDGQTYKYKVAKVEPWGPCHPVPPKSAAVAVMRGGMVKLWFHDKSALTAQARFKEATCELDNVSSILELFTHASFSYNKDNVAVIAAYTNSKQLRVYRFAIDWRVPTPQPKGQQPIFPDNPVLTVKRVKILPSVYPNELHEAGNKARLTHLEVLGPIAAPGALSDPPMPAENNPPTILAVFSRTTDGQTYTILCRWDLKESKSALHPSFEQLGARRASISQGQTQELDLIRLDDVVFSKSVLSVFSAASGTMVAFAMGDGTIEFRDRQAFAPFRTPTPDGHVEGRITNMIQAGFAFTGTEPCTDMVLSPNCTVAVRLTSGSDVHLNVIEFVSGSITEPANTELACVTLAAQHAYSCANYLNNDDLLLVARRYSSPNFNNTFLGAVHSSVNLRLDFAAESPSDRLIRNAILQRCLSLQYALDFRGENALRTMSGKLAFATLHLRVSSLAFGMTWNPISRPAASDSSPRPEAIQSILGLVRWFVDMMSLIIGDLLDLAAACKDRTDDLQFVRQKMLEHNSPALFLALASAPRAFLRYNCRSLRGLEAMTMRQVQHTKQQQAQQQGQPQGPISVMDKQMDSLYKSFQVPIETCAVRIATFERIMTDIDSIIRGVYSNVSEQERLNAERVLFVNGELPEVFKAPVDRLLREIIPGLRDQINVSQIFWHDVGWLGLHDDVESRSYAKKHRIDAVRKVRLPGGGNNLRLRRCTRCCSVVEDVAVTKNYGSWLTSTNRMCLCGTLWMHLAPYHKNLDG